MTLSSSRDPFFLNDSFPTPGIYSLSSDLPFLETLAESLLHSTQKAPLHLSKYTILFPTQRSLRAFKHILGHHADALFLPNLFTLNDLAPRAEDFLTSLFQNIPFESLQELSLPPPLSILRGSLLCAEALRRGGGLFNHTLNPEAQENLSKALLETLGELASHNVSLKDGDLHIPETHGIHWEKTTLFLKTILEIWPLILKAEEASDPLTFVQDRLKILSSYLVKSPPSTPIIVAGIRGLSPVFISFLKTIFNCSKGVFLVETFSKDFKDTSPQSLSPSHPSYELTSFLSELNVSPSHLKPWPFVLKQKDETLSARLSLINGTFPVTALNQKEPPSNIFHSLAKSLENISFFEAGSLLEEARVISLRMRHVLETPQKTAALITPDRRLAHLVKTELLKWDIIVDDSGGTSFAQTTVGRYFLKSLQTLLSHESPLLLISLLKDPLTRLGMNQENLDQALKTLELYALRGLKPSPGIPSLRHRLGSFKKEGDLALNDSLEIAEDLLKSFEEITSPFKNLLENGAPPAVLLKSHEEFLKALSKTGEGDSLLWQKEEEAEAESLFQTLIQETENLSPLTRSSYGGFLKSLLTKSTLQLTLPEHPRLSILGLFESRLLKKDSVILGGLNEGTWPDLPHANPWIHKNLREALSLPPLEARIGVSIQDFLHGFLNKEVLLTRSKRTKSGIERPSRILVHLTTFLESQNLSFEQPFEILLLKALTPPSSSLVKPPEANPPLSARPHRLTPSLIEMLSKDPYGFYAQTILNLRPLKPFEAFPTASDFGTLIHTSIENLSGKSFLPSEEVLRKEFKNTSLYKALSRGEQYFWAHRFLCILKNFWTQHAKQLQNPELLTISREVSVSHLFSISTNPKSFEIKGRIDRLEETLESFHIMDYKTGSLPSKIAIETGLNSQLPLLGLLLKETLTSQKRPLKNIALSYWPLKKDAFLPLNTLKNPETLIENTSQMLTEILDFFYNTETPGHFRATPYAHSSYAHLARIQEWAGPLEALLSESSPL
ncbi:MAG: double-strand break repair protein AddB [Alphaproteobacteria bacterium 16-39-46]|nr:MAG: double-strand break repair protein AddB [Alphaproteobacteria bacterium 16-39-46]OZA41065.1 MAG: double-strand break repair protein AddB [Alphaproteobacteria bacterium 17-39-52]HQS84908.1 double-strand break repair protein AddB [Alphaproteobacteria bacterium]HQS94678.1 double-strand break repair protein AddB [Alphaproteobacteria bacterium]